MNKDQIKGRVEEVKGKAKEVTGNVRALAPFNYLEKETLWEH